MTVTSSGAALPARPPLTSFDPDFAHLLAVLRIAFKQRDPGVRERVRTLRDQCYAAAVSVARAVDTAGPDDGCRLARRADLHKARGDALQAVLDEFEKALLNPAALEQGGPTAETVAHRGRPGALERLFLAGQLDIGEMQAANEIARVYRYATEGLTPRAVDYGYVNEGEDSQENRYQGYIAATEDMALLHVSVYRPWCLAQDPRDLAIVMGVAVDGRSLREVRLGVRMSWRTAAKRLRAALSAYLELRDGAGTAPVRPSVS